MWSQPDLYERTIRQGNRFGKSLSQNDMLAEEMYIHFNHETGQITSVPRKQRQRITQPLNPLLLLCA